MRHSIEPRQIQIQHNQVVFLFVGRSPRLFSIGTNVDCVTLGCQALADKLGQRLIVFGDQNPHKLSLIDKPILATEPAPEAESVSKRKSALPG